MTLFDDEDRQLAEAVSELAYCNPFLPERIEWERRALGEAFDDRHADWNLLPGLEDEHPNVARLLDLCERAIGRTLERLKRGPGGSDAEHAAYEDLVLFAHYHRYREAMDQLVARDESRTSGGSGRGGGGGGGGARSARLFERFHAELAERLDPARPEPIDRDEAAHLFACFFQIRRAFSNIFGLIVGRSAPTVRLRAAVWQSIFTCDMRRYRRVLYGRMGDYTTLITGPSGTGKELVARAVGLSRYVPFDPERGGFTGEAAGSFFAVNLSALSPTLIESELFGHRRGAFTGAAEDRTGWLEKCPALGTVFLDEVGELDAAIQVKLLRVLQERAFSRLGETRQRRFEGKVIAATNQPLAERMGAGRFREDFYYRLCSDIITTPSLRDRLDDDPGELRQLIAFIAARAVGDGEAPAVAGEVERWVREHLGLGYAWPGNVRELEQCVRNVLIRREYHPPTPGAGNSHGPRAALAESVAAGTLSADELLDRYCTLVYADTGSYEAAARHLGMDRRTVKARVDPELLEALRT